MKLIRPVLYVAFLCSGVFAFASGSGEVEEQPNNAAVCIGVSNYGTQERQLPEAAQDSIALASALSSRNMFRETILFTDTDVTDAREPSRTAILGELQRLKRQSQEEPLVDVVLFFSGHSVSSVADPTGESHLLLGQSRIHIQEELLPVVREIQCERMFVLFDACRTNSAQGLIDQPEQYQPGIDGIDISHRNSAVNGVVFVVYASSPGSPSVSVPGKGGVFTQALIDGLRIYNNYYDVFVYLDRTVPVRSFAQAQSGTHSLAESSPGEEETVDDAASDTLPRVQFVDFGGDYESLRAAGYPSFSDLGDLGSQLRAITAADSDVVKSLDSKLDQSQTPKRIGTITFSVGMGMLAASSANLTILSTLDNYYHDADMRRAKNISWTLFGASFLLTIPSAILAFTGL